MLEMELKLYKEMVLSKMFFHKPRCRICKLIHVRVKYLFLYFPFHWFVSYLVDNGQFQRKAHTGLCHVGLYVSVLINMSHAPW